MEPESLNLVCKHSRQFRLKVIKVNVARGTEAWNDMLRADTVKDTDGNVYSRRDWAW